MSVSRIFLQLIACAAQLQVCVPINPDKAENFDPVDGVPTVSQLLRDLDQNDLTAPATDIQVRRASSQLACVLVTCSA